MDALWADDPPRTAIKTLQNYVLRVRRALAQAEAATILTLPDGYCMRASLNELADNGTAPDAVIDRLRARLQTRIGTTRDRIDQDPDTEPEAPPEKELRADLIAAENAELSRLYEDGTISAATRSRLQRSLDLEVTRLAERQR